MSIKITLEFESPDEFFFAIENKIIQINNFGNAAFNGQTTGGDLVLQNAFNCACYELKQYIKQAQQLLIC
jgi:hypothetical protein